MPFSKETLDFLFENRIQDSKIWFEEHRGIYERVVLQPLVELVSGLSDTLAEIDPQIVCIPKVGKSISRIYRDTRFSNDKSLYRDSMWCAFYRDRKSVPNAPGFFFELSPGGFRYGCGYYWMERRLMNRIRERVLSDDKGYRKARKAFDSQSVFSVEGERYKRSPCPNAMEEQKDWAERKGISFNHNSGDFDLLFSDRLGSRLNEDFPKLREVYAFLLECAVSK